MHAFDLLIYALAAALTLTAYLRDPSLPGAGFRAGGQLLLDVLPRLIGALIVTGMIQALISPEWIQHWLGRGSTHRGILAGFVAGILTPGGPLVSFPIMVVFYKGGASLSALVAYMTSWSLFGFQRILAWELPFMGPRFLLARVLPTLVFPVLAGYLVRFIYRD
ncbi:MAG TPA: permease [Methylomirabilota bacterium]|jgi:uncharacterized membrane protein YraQ (UPF0718 family)|nr:permease [Methylomirabilota bacterium]